MSGPAPTLPEIRRSLVQTCRELHRRGWVANHDGNVSVRLPGSRVIVTPTAMSKARVAEADLVEIDLEGRIRGGSRRPPSEVGLHLLIYREREDARAVVHAHPPGAVAHAVAGVDIPTAMMAEPVVSIGGRIPLLPFAPPGSADLHAHVAAALRSASCLLMELHGPIVAGSDLEQALLRMELVEHLAEIHERAQNLGGARRIPEPLLEELLAHHRKAGLAPPPCVGR